MNYISMSSFAASGGWRDQENEHSKRVSVYSSYLLCVKYPRCVMMK